MWRSFKKAKEVWDWIALAWGVVGWLGLTAFITGLVATTVATVGAYLTQLPLPVIVAVGWSMVVGTVNLIALPAVFRALRELRISPDTSVPKARTVVRPHLDAWRHVERFTIDEAACLWVEIEPKSRTRTTETAVWVDALCAAIRKGELGFLPNTRSFSGMPSGLRESAFKYQQKDADAATMVGRDQLTEFAKAKGYHPKFLG